MIIAFSIFLQHEEASHKMFDHLIDKEINEHVADKFEKLNLTKDDIDFIKDLIHKLKSPTVITVNYCQFLNKLYL